MVIIAIISMELVFSLGTISIGLIFSLGTISLVSVGAIFSQLYFKSELIVSYLSISLRRFSDLSVTFRQTGRKFKVNQS